MLNKKNLRDKTIIDFKNQWSIHGELKDDYWSSVQWIQNICANVFDLENIENKMIMEVGSGSGRILRMLETFKPKKIISIEPSNSEALIENTRHLKNIIIDKSDGSSFKHKNLDYIFSIGVIHHIVDPDDVVTNIYNSLNTDGKFIMWVYGKENNRAYLTFYQLVCWLTKRMDDRILNQFSNLLNIMILPYILFCKLFPFLPLSSYINNVFSKCGFKKRKYIIFDQLNPTFSKYYTKNECYDLFERHGFKKIKLKHYNNYSWVVVGQK